MEADYNVKIFKNKIEVFDFVKAVGRPTSASSEAAAIRNANAWFAYNSGYSRVDIFLAKNKDQLTYQVEQLAPKKKEQLPPTKPKPKPEQLRLF